MATTMQKMWQVVQELKAGGSVKLGGVTYIFSADDQLCVRATRLRGTTSEDIGLVSDMPLNEFMRLCGQLSEDDYVGLVGKHALLKQQEARDRQRDAARRLRTPDRGMGMAMSEAEPEPLQDAWGHGMGMAQDTAKDTANEPQDEQGFGPRGY